MLSKPPPVVLPPPLALRPPFSRVLSLLEIFERLLFRETTMHQINYFLKEKVLNYLVLLFVRKSTGKLVWLTLNRLIVIR